MGKLWLKIVPAMFAAFIVAGFLRNFLQADAGFRAFVDGTACVGRVIFICGLVVFVVDLAA